MVAKPPKWKPTDLLVNYKLCKTKLGVLLPAAQSNAQQASLALRELDVCTLFLHLREITAEM